jgi:hypothetical protein
MAINPKTRFFSKLSKKRESFLCLCDMNNLKIYPIEIRIVVDKIQKERNWLKIINLIM